MRKIPSITTTEINHVEAGENIRVLREAKGISGRKLAKLLGVSAPFLHDLEHGRRSWSVERFNEAVKILNKA